MTRAEALILSGSSPPFFKEGMLQKAKPFCSWGGKITVIYNTCHWQFGKGLVLTVGDFERVRRSFFSEGGRFLMYVSQEGI